MFGNTLRFLHATKSKAKIWFWIWNQNVWTIMTQLWTISLYYCTIYHQRGIFISKPDSKMSFFGRSKKKTAPSKEPHYESVEGRTSGSFGGQGGSLAASDQGSLSRAPSKGSLKTIKAQEALQKSLSKGSLSKSMSKHMSKESLKREGTFSLLLWDIYIFIQWFAGFIQWLACWKQNVNWNHNLS